MATASSAKAEVGTIKVAIGDVKVVGVDGIARQVQVGDKVYAKEVIQTSANAVVQVQLADGRMLDLGRDSKIALDDDLLGTTPSATGPAPAAPEQDIAALQAAIAAGADPSKVAEATAAGGAPGAGGAGGENEGHEPVVIGQANSKGPVTAGYQTGPAAIAFPEPTPYNQLQAPPTVSVNVEVQVQVNVQPPSPPPGHEAEINLPFARTDTDVVPVGTSVATGNVITSVGTTSGLKGADTPGADGATVTAITGTPISNSNGVITVAGEFGTLTINPDGSYVYARTPGAPDGVIDKFTYTLTDGTGDKSTADLIIDVGGNGDGTPDLPNDPDGDGVVVSGNGATLIEGTDGPDKIVNFVLSLDHAYFQDVQVTYTIVPGTAQSPADFGGVLHATVTIPAGETKFIVPVSIVQDHLVESNEGFSIVLTDAVNASINQNADTAFVTIIDDDLPPLARDDSYDVVRGQPNSLTSVLTHKDPGENTDDSGAGPGETLTVTTTGTIITAQGGTVVMNPDGTFVYNPPVNLHGPDTFVYSMTDGFNGTSTALVTLNAPNDPPTVKFDLAPGEGIVNEAGLAIGSNAPSASEFTHGKFTISDPDGLADIASVTINGQTIAVNNLQGSVITTPTGVMTINSYDPATGISSFTYELKVPVTDVPNQAETDAFTVTVTDKGEATSAPAKLAIDIIDDVPVARNDTDSVASGSFIPETGNVLTGAGTAGGLAGPGADTKGADSAVLTGISVFAGGAVPQNADSSFTVNGQYGVLTINPNGEYSYARNLGTPGGVQDKFTYTLTDGDGDISSANLTIDIGNAPVELFLKDARVFEAGLPVIGSHAGDGSNITTGNVTFNAKDGLQGVTVDGTLLTGAPNQQILGDHGTLTVSALNYDVTTGNGTLTYSYKLTQSTSGDTTFDDFAVVVTDKGGGTSDGVLNISIVDDVPTARSDADAVGAGSFVETGNVVTGAGTTGGLAGPGADTKGADSATVTAVTGSNGTAQSGPNGALVIHGLYGDLTIQANGDYSYTRAAGTPGGVTDTFRYTLTDTDGDASAANLVISIGDAPVTLALPDTQVNEAGLPTGSHAGDGSNSTTGTITFNSKDGLQGVTLDGVAIHPPVAGQPPQIITGPGHDGALAVTGFTFDVVTGQGSLSYSYTLTKNTAGDTTSDSFAVVVTDGNSSKAGGPLTIDIVDDVPTARNDFDTVAAGSFGPETGNVITAVGTVGAPGPDTLGADNATLISIASNNAPGNAATNAAGVLTINGQYGVLTINPDGEYSYTRAPGTAGGVTDTFRYTLRDGDGDTSAANLAINIASADKPVTDVPSTLVNEAGLSPLGSHAGDGSNTVASSFTFKSVDGLSALTLDGEAIHTPVAGSPQIITGAFGSLTVTGFGYSEVTGNGFVNYSYTLTTKTSGDTTSDNFAVGVSDKDGNKSDGTLKVGIIDDVPVARNDTDSVASGSFIPETGNVLTGAGTAGGLAGPGADTKGADSAVLTGISVFAGGAVPQNADSSFTVNGQYGVLTINPNGEYSYARNLGTPGGVQDKFTYTLTDGDGDISSANLTIDIGNAPVELFLKDARVFEAGLPVIGSHAGDGSNITTGNVTFNAKDGLQGVTVDGTLLTGAPNQQILGDHGTLTVSALNYDVTTGNGTLTYSYKLTQSTSGDTTFDDFAVVVTDKGGGTSDGVLNISIVDDVPTARSDADAVGAGSFVETGNVVTGAGTTGGLAGPGADTKGADSATVTAVTGSNGTAQSGPNGALVIHGLYGDLTIQANGDYSYTRAAGTPGGVTDTFRYTLTDTDGDASAANLVISIGDAPVTLALPDTQVNEAGLPTGSHAGDGSNSTTGTITFNSKDGLQGVTLDGVAIHPPVAGQPPQIITGPGHDGALAVTGFTFDVVTGQGSLSYSYTLTKNTAGDTTSDSFAVVVTDGNSSKAGGPLTIDIVDDVPTARNDFDTVAAGSFGPETGNVITAVGTVGAPGPDTLGADNATLISIASNNAPGNAATNAAGVLTINGQYGVLTINPDGEYSYTRAPGTAGGVTDTFRYTLRDGDGDTSAANLAINIASADKPVTDVPSTLVNEAGLSPLGSHAGDGSNTVASSFTFKSVDGLSALTLDGEAIHTPVAGSPQIITGAFGSLTVTGFGYSEVTGNGFVNYSYTLTTKTSGDTTSDNFAVGVSDKDGNKSDGTLKVGIIDDVPTAHADTGAINSGGTITTTSVTGVELNDTFGADGKEATGGVVGVKAGNDTGTPVAGSTGTPIVGALGTLTLNADGSYKYVANPNVGGIDTFVYTIKDGDGDLSTTTLTINVNPINPQPVVGMVTVDEAALATGSNPTSTAEIGNGNLGLLNGVSVVIGAQQDQTGTHGTLHVNPDGSFTYTLTSRMDSGAVQGANTVNGVESFTVTTTDTNGNTGSATITVNVKDDIPSIADNVVPIVAAVQEDGMAGAATGDLSTGNKEASDTNSDDEASSTIAGSLLTLVKTGADTPPTFGLKLDANDLPTLFSQGANIGYATSDTNGDNVADTLIASTTDGRTIFTLHVNVNGTWEFDLKDQLDHVAGGGENFELRTNAGGTTSVPNIDFSKLIQITDADGDTAEPLGVGNFAVRVQDDIPTRAADLNVKVSATVQEDGMAGAATGDLSTGNKEAGGSNTDDEAAGAAGSLTKLFSAGADEVVTIGLTSDASALAGLPALLSKGEAVTYSVAGDVLTATAGGRDVFTLTVNKDGSWSFDLKDQLDHVAGGGENTALRTVGGGSVGNIDLSSVLTVTDADGDTLVKGLNAGDFAITVQDDIPTRAADLNVKVSATVQEDGMAGAATGDLSTGNKEAGGSNTDDEAAGAAGSLTKLFSAGADEVVTIGLTSDASALAGLPALLSKGEAVTYSVAGDVLTATAGGRDVFTLTVNKDGSWSFDLKDQLDHVAGGGENTALRTVGGGSVGNIDLSSVLTVTDADGDTLVKGLNAGDFAITVQDDIPTRAADLNVKVSATVQEDGMAGAATGDLSTGNKEAGGSNTDDEAAGAAGSLTKLFSAGADEVVTIGLTSDASALAGLPALLSKGEAVTYSVAGDVLTATAGGRDVFTLTVNKDGSWSFDLKDQLDHVAGGGENTALRTVGGGSVGNIDLSSVLTVTDADGDTLVKGLNAGDFAITVQDDIPTRAADLNVKVSATVQEDGMAGAATGDLSTGNKEAGGSNTDDEAAGAAGSLTKLFSAGADEVVTIGLTSDASALAGLPALLSKGEAVTYSVAGDVLTATAGGRDVFTLTVNKDGSWSFDLKDQLDHVAGGGENTALRTVGGGSVGNIDLSSVLTVTDADGDTLVKGLNAGDFAITVQDDIPTRAADLNVKVSATVQEDGMAGAATGDLSTGNKEAGGSNTDDEAAGAAGSLTKLFSAGADEVVTIGLTSDASALAGLPALLSKGEAVTYSVAGDVLTATAGGRDVFTLTVNKDGSWSFDLKDQLDHVAGGGENTALRTVGGGSVGNIDLSSVLTVTDADGDTLVKGLNAGDFAITVQDDIPVMVAGASIIANVDEDALSGANADANRAGEITGTGSAVASGGAGALNALVSVGADENLTFSLNPVTTPETLAGVTSQGGAISIVTDANGLHGYVNANAATPGFDAGDREVFTLTVGTNGSYTFTLKGPIDHPTLNGLPGDNTENQLGTALDLSKYISAKDNDGDSITLAGGAFKINVQDDIPVAADITKSTAADVHAVTNLTLVLDISGSMTGTVTVNGQTMTRYDAEKQSAKALIDAYETLGDVKVNIVTFSAGSTHVGSYWMDSAAAKTAIDGIPAPGGTTNYAAGLDTAKLGYDGTHNGNPATAGNMLANAKDAFYFLSDGVPNPTSTGLDATETTAWEAFLRGDPANGGNAAAQQITAYALGMGPDVVATELNPIAYNGATSTNTNAIIVSDFNQLTATLLSTIEIPPVSGNLLTDPNPDGGFGADGGHVQSITVNGVTYTVDAALNTITTTGTATTGTNTFVFDNPNNVLTVTIGSATGAKMQIDLDNGDYTYTAVSGQTVSKVENIGYVLTDNDGDTASANLRINVDIPTLIVGRNVSDVSGQTEVHQVDPNTAPNNAGVISGVGANDVLIGDVGGSVSGTYNLTLVLDVSGSIDANEFTLMKNAVKGLLDKYAGATELHVDLGIFATGSHDYGTIGDTTTAANLTTAQAIAAAKTAIDNINRADAGAQNTNYQAALDMLNTMVSNDPAADHKQVFFLTDGDPTTGNVANPSNGASISVDAKLATLSNLSDTAIAANHIEINAVAIGLTSSAAPTNMNQLDNTPLLPTDSNGHHYIAVSSFADLAAGLGAVLVPVSLGSDSIVGGDGNDAILGDSIFSTSADKGWADYVATHTGLTAEQMRADIYANLTEGNKSYAKEGTMGGNDTIDGGAGNDVIYGQGGNDLIIGGAGNDILSGGSGADIFKWSNADKGTFATPAVDTITDFNATNAAANKDVLDLRDLLIGEHAVGTPGNPANLSDYLTFVQNGANVTLSVHSAGDPTHSSATVDQTIVLQNVTMQQLAGLSPAAPLPSSGDVITNLLANNKLITD